MSAKSFGRALRSRRPTLQDVCSSSSSPSSTRPATACCCQLDISTGVKGVNGSSRTVSRPFTTSTSLSAGSKQQKRNRQLAKMTLPVFPTTRNEPLNELIATLNRDQFIIDHLPDSYHRLVTKTTKHALFAEQAAAQAFSLSGANSPDPTTLLSRQRKATNTASSESTDTTTAPIPKLTITLDNQPVTLQPLTHRTLHSSRSLTKALNLLTSPAEYDILPPLVSELAHSKILITPTQFQSLIRACGLAGRPGIALKIANEGLIHRRNNFSYTRASLREMIRAQFVRFLIPGEKYSDQAISRARGVISVAKGVKEWYDREQIRLHQSERGPAWLVEDPVVRGSLVFLLAGRRVRFDDGVDSKHGDVAKAVNEFMAVWGSAKEEILATVREIDAAVKERVDAEALLAKKGKKGRAAEYRPSKTGKEPDYALARKAIMDWEPVLQGLKWAEQVMTKSGSMGATVAEWMPPVVKALTGVVERWRPVALRKGGERLGIQVFEGAYGDLGGFYEKSGKGGKAVVADRVLM